MCSNVSFSVQLQKFNLLWCIQCEWMVCITYFITISTGNGNVATMATEC